ncbi:MAG: hypothetical protein BWY63_01956 [Chloroflexi bacterium ADurb.Bin360]|nr:MAG: hypothetical protein BWY63_01956 [Chloroflexi bacterium ADurb.Bin360]
MLQTNRDNKGCAGHQRRQLQNICTGRHIQHHRVEASRKPLQHLTELIHAKRITAQNLASARSRLVTQYHAQPIAPALADGSPADFAD